MLEEEVGGVKKVTRGPNRSSKAEVWPDVPDALKDWAFRKDEAAGEWMCCTQKDKFHDCTKSVGFVFKVTIVSDMLAYSHTSRLLTVRSHTLRRFLLRR